MKTPALKSQSKAVTKVNAPMAVVIPTITTRMAEGFNVKAGKPLAWLTPAQLAIFFGVDRSSIYRWKEDGTIPPEFIRPGGKRKLQISAAAVEIVQANLRKLRGFDDSAEKQILNTV